MGLTKRVLRLIKSEGEDLYRRLSGEEVRPRSRGRSSDEPDWEKDNSWYQGGSTSSGGSASSSSGDDPIQRAYRLLEVPEGSDFKAVKTAYRKLMRDYHPDKFHNEPQKLEAANKVTRELSAAYELLKKHLGGH